MLLLLAFLVFTESYIIHVNLPKLNITNFNSTTHLSYKHIQRICDNKDSICKANDSQICTTRKNDNESSFKDFDNTCFLFLYNMCVSPGFEYSVVSSGTCEEYFKARRSIDASKNKSDSFNEDNKNVTNGTGVGAVTKILRTKVETTFSPLYDIDTAFDYHICPLSCPDTYSPICVSANRGFGKYFKFYTFVNHCAGDLYYCKNWEEFSPPPDEDEKVSSSPLSWSYCGASRYLQFSRFAEVASSMGHYGWLAGDYRYSHIMEPHERLPGFGK